MRKKQRNISSTRYSMDINILQSIYHLHKKKIFYSFCFGFCLASFFAKKERTSHRYHTNSL